MKTGIKVIWTNDKPISVEITVNDMTIHLTVEEFIELKKLVNDESINIGDKKPENLFDIKSYKRELAKEFDKIFAETFKLLEEK